MATRPAGTPFGHTQVQQHGSLWGPPQQPGQRPRSPRPTPTRTGLFVCLQFEGGRSTEEIRKFWQNYEHPSINKQEWSEQEVAQLKAVAAKHGHLDWQSIAEELGVRVTLRPGPALAAARGSAQATQEGSWRVCSGHSGRQLEGRLGPLGRAAGGGQRLLGPYRLPWMPSQAASVFCLLRPLPKSHLLLWTMLWWSGKTLYLVPLGFVLSRLLRQGLSSHSPLSLMKMVFEAQFSKNSVVQNVSFLSVLE